MAGLLASYDDHAGSYFGQAAQKKRANAGGASDTDTAASGARGLFDLTGGAADQAVVGGGGGRRQVLQPQDNELPATAPAKKPAARKRAAAAGGEVGRKSRRRKAGGAAGLDLRRHGFADWIPAVFPLSTDP